METVEEKIDDDDDEETMSKVESQHRVFQSEDVLMNVLSKLPVKTLLRFRCVCKRWRYLISDDPYFFQLHSQHSKSKPLLLFDRKCRMGIVPLPVTSMDRNGNPISSFELSFNAHLPRIIPTRFDLVCISDDDADHIVNPSTREFIKLPDPPFPGHGTVGFGYVESTEEYKVVRLTYLGWRLGGKCNVFTVSSSSSWAWREAVDPPIDVLASSGPAFVNEAIHWLVYGENAADTILAFDVENEDFRLVRIPEDYPEPTDPQRIYPMLVELKGFLSILYTKDSIMDVWMLKDYCCGSGDDHDNGTWVKEYSINLLNIWPPTYESKDQDYCCLFTLRDAEETKVLIEKYMEGVRCYDLQTKRFKELVHNSKMEFCTWSFYVESLRSLKRTISSTGEKIERAEAKVNVTN